MLILLVTVYEVVESPLWLLTRLTEIFNLVAQRQISGKMFTNEQMEESLGTTKWRRNRKTEIQSVVTY